MKLATLVHAAGWLCLAAWTACSGAAAGGTSLAGQWRFQLDRRDVGMDQRWFHRALEERIELPGAMQAQGFGDDVTVDTAWTANVQSRRWFTAPEYAEYRRPGNVKVPFWLQPDKHYVGAAWYQREIEIPEAWRENRVVLSLERPHWQTRAWLDDREIGQCDSLSTPHVYDLGTGLSPGTHRLTIRVDNRMAVDVGVWAHSVSDHTQGNWNGVVGRIELSATRPVWLDDVQAYPDVKTKTVRLRVRIGNASGKPGAGTLSVGSQSVPVTWDARGGAAEIEVALGSEAKLWDEFQPAVQTLTVVLTGRQDNVAQPPSAGEKLETHPGAGVPHGDQADDRRDVRFGLREIGADGTQFTINGRKTFLRGTLECCIFPLTGYPPTHVEAWKRIIRICKAHGLNHIRFHSWCPPEAAFDAADESGFYYQVECAAWTTVGDGKPIDEWLYEEGRRITRAYGNHPSFVLMPYGNEPSGAKAREFLTRWVDYWKARDPRRVYTSGSGWPQLAENEYHVMPAPRGPSGWGGGDYRDPIKPFDVPVVAHEIGQWCVYPNFDEIKKYTGPLKPKNFDIFRDSLAAHGMIDQARDFLMASGKLQALCYKEEIEAELRTPGLGGFQLLDLHDFPGQGTALVGVLDPFWDDKGYITAEQFRRFCGTTVPLARMKKRTWTDRETLVVDVEVAHFGPEPLGGAVAAWKVLDPSGATAAAGELPARDVPLGNGIALGQISLDLAKLDAPSAYKLVVGLKGTPAENDWNLWVYPAAVSQTVPEDVTIADAIDNATLARLIAGGKVLLLPSPKRPDAGPQGSFAPVFWNRQWFPKQACQTLGLLCQPQHPALAGFPTEFHCDWQWADLVNHSQAVVLDDLPGALRPIVQVIDDWNTNRRLGLIFECRVGKGRLLVCAADVTGDLEHRPAAAQLRRGLLDYMAGPRFEPQVELRREDLPRLFAEPKQPRLVKLGAKVLRVDSEAPGYEAAGAFDGDPETIWHTKWEPAPDPMPHELVLDLGQPVTIRGLSYLPRQDMSNGRIGRCEVFCGGDLGSWGRPIASLQWPNTGQLQTVRFPAPVTGRYLKLVVHAEVSDNSFASIAELDILE